MGGAALVLWMNSIGKDNHFVCSQFPHQGLILGDKRSLFGLISLRGQLLYSNPRRRISLAAPEGQ